MIRGINVKRRILVVDNDADMCNTIAEFLRKDGYHIDVTNGVTPAISCMKSKNYDILLIDKNMPGLDGNSQEGGMDLLRYVRMQSIPSEIIMMTGDATIDTVIEAMNLGAFDYLLKPSLKELKVKISRIFDYRSFFNPNETIELYKGIQGEIINLINNKSNMTDSEFDSALMLLNDNIHKIFMELKESEKYALVQREYLAYIAAKAEQIKSQISETHQSYSLIDEICNCSSKRL
jgi:DNA-binding NtrC family response regulator